MRNRHAIGVIIPALNEERAIAKVLGDIPDWVDRVIVADNGSTDATGDVARKAGADLIHVAERGYGAACLAAIDELCGKDGPEIIVFIDGDYSDHPEQMSRLVDPIAAGHCAITIGSRVLGKRETGALTLQQRWGNWLACTLIRLIWGARYTDLGPFRAIRSATLKTMDMRDRNYGWTVEMQIKAAIMGASYREVPVDYRVRIGKSKVSGTVKGTFMAGLKILTVIARSALSTRPRSEALMPAATMPGATMPEATMPGADMPRATIKVPASSYDTDESGKR